MVELQHRWVSDAESIDESDLEEIKRNIWCARSTAGITAGIAASPTQCLVSFKITSSLDDLRDKIRSSVDLVNYISLLPGATVLSIGGKCQPERLFPVLAH